MFPLRPAAFLVFAPHLEGNSIMSASLPPAPPVETPTQTILGALRSVNQFSMRNQVWMGLLTLSAVVSVAIAVLNVFQNSIKHTDLAAWIAGLTALNASAISYYGVVKDRVTQANKCKATLNALLAAVERQIPEMMQNNAWTATYKTILEKYPDAVSYIKGR